MVEPAQQATPDESFQTNLIIHLALLGGCVLPVGIAIFLVYGTFEAPLVDESTAVILTGAGLLLAVVAPFLGQALFRRLIDDVEEEATLSTKLEAFRTASIVRWAILEGAALMALVFYLLAQSILLLVAALAVLAVFAMLPANRSRFMDTFRLSAEEEDRLRPRS